MNTSRHSWHSDITMVVKITRAWQFKLEIKNVLESLSLNLKNYSYLATMLTGEILLEKKFKIKTIK